MGRTFSYLSLLLGLLSTEMTFYAGLSCGARPGCATAGVGRVNAAVTFTFEYD